MNRAALSPAALWTLAKESVMAWIDDFAPSMGAAIAYYTAFSIGPLLIIVIAIAGFFFGSDAASGYLYAQLAGLLGDQGAEVIKTMVESASNSDEGFVASAISVVLLVIGATTVFAELQSDLDRIWKAPAAKKAEGLWELIRGRVLSLGLVVSIGFLMLVSLVLSAALAALSKWWGGVFENFEWLLHVLDIVVSLGIITIMFALMYKILPRVKIGWSDVWVGSVATAVLFTIGKFLVGLYLGKSSVASSFGTAGSLAVLLVWVYYSAQIFLLGAEFTWVYAHRFGSRQGQDQPATAKESVAATDAPQGESGLAPTTHGERAQPVSTAAPVTAAYALPVPEVVRRHPAAIAGGALLVGALAGELVNRYQKRSRSRHTSLAALAGEMLALRKAAKLVRR